MAIVYVDVVGEILAGDGTPAVGDVIFQIPVTLRDVVDNVVYAAGSTFTETLAVDGTFTFVGLPATDSPDVTPADWLYRVHVHTDIMAKSFSTSLPAAFAPTAEFADLIPAQFEPCTTDGTPCATLAQIADLQAQIDAIEGSDVISVNGQTGVVVLDAADVGADPAGSAAQAEIDANAYTDAEISALDALVVHRAGAESITGVKTFVANPIFNAAGIPQAAVANLVADLASKAVDALVVHLAGAENITGTKTFVANPIFNAAGIPQAAVANLIADLASKAVDSLVVHLAGAENITGVKTFNANPVFNAAGIPQSAVAALVADLAARVVGPAAATDNALTRFDLTTGKLVQDSTTTLADSGEMINRGDLIVRKIAATGEYGLRVSGGGLDFDAAGFDLFISVWSGTGVGIGTQRTYIRAESGAQLLHALGRWIWATTPFGAAVHALDPVTGVAELGGKNGLLPWRICGRGVVPGAPVAGTWAVGDIMMDSAGEIWLCTVAGTPGTWVTGP